MRAWTEGVVVRGRVADREGFPSGCRGGGVPFGHGGLSSMFPVSFQFYIRHFYDLCTLRISSLNLAL